jgi:ankyrin repeat protein
MYAAYENDLILTTILLCHNSNVNAKDSLGRNALFYAILNNSGNGKNDISEIVQLLIKNEINVNEADNEGQTPLTLATSKGLKSIVQIFLENGGDIDHKITKDGNTPLHIAVINNRVDMINLLLTKKPDLSIQNKTNRTPIDIASAETSKTEIYSILAEEYNLRERELMLMKSQSLSNMNNSNTNSHNSNVEIVEEMREEDNWDKKNLNCMSKFNLFNTQGIILIIIVLIIVLLIQILITPIAAALQIM